VLKFNKATMLGIYAMLEIARAGDTPVSSTEIAERHGVSKHHLAKVLQTLVRAGFLTPTRGVRGGYQLVADPKNVTLGAIVEVFEGPRAPPESCLLQDLAPLCDRRGVCSVQSVFRELDEQVAFTLDSLSLKTLLRNEIRRS
jgi:Rrf2 family protein